MSNMNQTSGQGSIRFLTGPLAGRTFELSKPIITIGRDNSNDIFVTDPKVSRFHARLLWNNGSWSIEKVSQTSTVSVNQQPVQQSFIYNNNVVGLGDDSSFLFLLPSIQVNAQFNERPPLKPQPPTERSGGSVPLGSPTNPMQRPNHPGLVQQPITDQPLPRLSSSPAQSQPDNTSNARLPIQQRPSSSLPGSGGLSQRPDETAIASVSALGIPSIEVSSNTSGEKNVYLLDKPVINVGREASNDIVIHDRIISGLHLQIVRQGNQFILIHPHPSRQNTVNGLLYEGRKIRGDESFHKPLTRGDLFRIGDENGTLITLTYNDGSGTEQETMPSVRPFKLSDTEITIGRNPDNKLVLAHPQVSAHHARLVREGALIAYSICTAPIMSMSMRNS